MKWTIQAKILMRRVQIKNSAFFMSQIRSPSKKSSAYHLKYWPLWLVLSLFRLLTYLPFDTQIAIGKTLGLLFYFVLFPWRKIAKINLAICFPTLSAKDNRRLVKRHFQSLGAALMETNMAHVLASTRLANRIHIQGKTLIEEALKQNKGVFIIGGHFTTIDMIGRLLGEHFKFCVVARHQNNAVIDALLKQTRNRGSVTIIDRKNLRGMITALNNNLIVWYAPDQDYRAKRKIFSPFFGVSTACITAPVRLAKLTGAPVLFFSHFRDKQNHYHAHIQKAPEHFNTLSEEDAWKVMNQFLETAIRKHPEQYLWIHRRFKTRPLGEKDIYTQRNGFLGQKHTE